MAKNALMVVEDAIKDDDQFRFYWEWPKNATDGWRLDAMIEFQKKMKALGVRLYWTEMHGCAFGMKTDEGDLLNKAWYVMTNDADFNYHGQILCPGNHQHREGGAMGLCSKGIEATGFYPEGMVKKIVKIWKSTDKQR